MDAVFERYPEERDRTHEPRLFETVLLSCGLAEAAARVAGRLPWLLREETAAGVAFRSPRHAGTPVVAEIVGSRPGHAGSRLRYRRAYRADPPLGSTYDAPAGRQVLAVLEPYLWQAPATNPNPGHGGGAQGRPVRIPRRWRG